MLQRWAAERPDRNFLEFVDGSAWTFADTLDRVQRAAGALRDLGVEQGTPVLNWMPNRREAVLVWLAANYIGAINVPVNTGYRGRLLEHVIELSGAAVMVVDAGLALRLNEVGTASLTDLIVVNGAVDPPTGFRVHGAELLERERRASAARPVAPWDTNCLMLTSGTTGPSKAVISTYVQSWCGSVLGMDYYGPDDRVLANLPLFHVSGTGAVMDRLIKGGTCVLVDGFSPSSFFDVVRHMNVTGACLVGAMTQFLLRQPPGPLDRDHPLRDVVTVPWNQESRALAERFGLRMHTAFNMTELAVPIRSEANPVELGTCGRPRAGIEARIVDAQDREVPVGATGELILRSDRPWEISPGYHRDPVATAAAWRNGWFHTGDAFRRDAVGSYFFVDRLKDSIRRRGENISSFEVEAEALRHPAVLEAAAIPVPSAEGEDEVMLVLTLNTGRSLDPAALLEFLEPRMAPFMLPRYVRVVDAMPKTPTAKIEKHRLRAEGVTQDSWDREAHGFAVRGGRLRQSASGTD